MIWVAPDTNVLDSVLGGDAPDLALSEGLTSDIPALSYTNDSRAIAKTAAEQNSATGG